MDKSPNNEPLESLNYLSEQALNKHESEAESIQHTPTRGVILRLLQDIRHYQSDARDVANDFEVGVQELIDLKTWETLNRPPELRDSIKEPTTTATTWSHRLWSMSIIKSTSEQFGVVAHQILVQGRNEGNAKREELLRLCHTVPQAVEMDTRDLEAAIRRLVDFAWESVQG